MGVQVLHEKIREDKGSCNYPLLVLEAIDLYKRGLNVFPVPRPEEVMNLANLFPQRYEANQKIPYVLRPLFYSRMHLCNWKCKEETNRNRSDCLGVGKPYQFEELFLNSNLAVMLGRTSDNLVCIDCDDQIAFDQCLDAFTSLNLPYWAYETSRGGNILIRMLEGEAKNSKSTSIKNIEIWGNKHYCILPPSVHPTGIIYRWVKDINPRAKLKPYEAPPLLTIGQLDWLGVKVKKGFQEQSDFLDLPRWTEILSLQNRKILGSKIHEGERNHLLTKVIYDIAAAILSGHVSENEAIHLLYKVADNCAPPYPRIQINHMLASALSKPRLELSKKYYGSYPKQRNSTINNPYELYLTYPWSSLGRTGLTDKAVFLACIKRAELDGSYTFRASAREIATLANLQKHQTALKALNRLCDLKLLSREGKDKSGANCYAFGNPDIKRTTINTNNSSGPLDAVPIHDVSLPTQSQRDVFSSLGRVSYLVWNHLLCKPERTKADIARHCSLKYSSVSAAMRKLQQNKLVVWSSAEGLFIGESKDEAEMISIARNLGVGGRSERRDFRFQRERELRVNQQIFQAKKKLFHLVYNNVRVINEN